MLMFRTIMAIKKIDLLLVHKKKKKSLHYWN